MAASPYFHDQNSLCKSSTWLTNVSVTKLFSICLIVGLNSATSYAAVEKKPITPQDIWAVKRVDSPAMSPDKKQLVFTVQEWSIEKNKPTTQIWSIATQSSDTSNSINHPKRLTTTNSNDSSPVWSPDSQKIAFISKRAEDDSSSLYILPIHGGEAEKVLELPNGMSNPRWMPDGKSIVIATTSVAELSKDWSQENLALMAKELKRRKESKLNVKVTEDRQYRYWDHWITDGMVSHLLKIDLSTKKITDLTPESKQLFQVSGEASFDISPDGKQLALAYNTVQAPHSDPDNVDIFLISSDGSGVISNLTLDNPALDASPKFSPDGQYIFYTRLNNIYYDGSFLKLWKHDLRKGKNFPVTENLDYGISDFRFNEDGTQLFITAEDKGYVPVFQLPSNPQVNTVMNPLIAEGSSSHPLQAGSQLYYLNMDSNHPNELFALDLRSKKSRQITHFNDVLNERLNLGKTESYWFDGANGEKVQGWLIFPPDYDANKTYPLLQLMHGGPHTMNASSWSHRWNSHVFAAPGYIVTWVNRHGSTGFGEKFSRSINNQWGIMPTEDILNSTDYLLKRFPNIDSKRIAAAGGSYGGFMAAWLAGHTDRFATLIDHAGVNDFVTQYGSDVTNYGFSKILGGSPWENSAGMQANNPVSFAKNFKTPMLIIHGELDYRVPYVNGTALYGILQSMKIPSRLVIFPTENHWILSPQNAIYWHWEMQNWLSKYIGGTPSLVKPNF